MAWNIIGGFLEKFSNLKLTKDFYRDEIGAVIKDVLGVEVELENIDYKFDVVLIKTNNPIIKNKIFMNKSKILENFSKKIKFNKLKPKEIRFLG